MGTSSFATVSGVVSGPTVADFSGCRVFLTDVAGDVALPSGLPMVSPDGSYVVPDVSPGRWTAVCLPDPLTPLTAMTYHQWPGLPSSRSTAIRAHGGQGIRVDFALLPAGNLAVTVSDQTGSLMPGALVNTYNSSIATSTGPAAFTDSEGFAYFTNVPVSFKLLAIDPTGSTALWWGGGTNWGNAAVNSLPYQGSELAIALTL